MKGLLRVIIAFIVCLVALAADSGIKSATSNGSKSMNSKKSTCTSSSSSSSCRISNIVVLMMENRSFDHLLGWLKKDYKSSIEGLSDGMSLPRDVNDPSKGSVAVTRNAKDRPDDDPLHDFNNIAVQINGNKMDGFVYDSLMHHLSENNPVDMFDFETAPIINTLAKEYAVFDSWFASIPGPTDPNRQFAMSGTSLGI
jgi:phospholipase C